MGYERAVHSYRKTRIETADQIQLIIMCYEEAIGNVRQAKINYEQGYFENKAKFLRKSQEIIGELFASLNSENGGIIAANLASIYTYMIKRLTEGDIEKDMKAFDDVAELLSELLGAWQEIAANGTAKIRLPNADTYATSAMPSRRITA